MVKAVAFETSCTYVHLDHDNSSHFAVSIQTGDLYHSRRVLVICPATEYTYPSSWTLTTNQTYVHVCTMPVQLLTLDAL